jgi:hypothetical protein
MMLSADWYYCLEHRAVEPYEGCRSATRLGPYRTIDEAQAALIRVAQRNEAWDNDPRFNDPESDDAESRPDEEQPGWGPFGG